jgi:hypothetical protein
MNKILILNFMTAFLVAANAAGGDDTAGTHSGVHGGELYAKKRIPDAELAKKKEGCSWMVFPGPGYDPDLGFVIGAVAGFYDNGKRSAPYFAYEPYAYEISSLGSWSTRGLFSGIIDLDVPYVKNTSLRLRTRLSYIRNLQEPYFGMGEQTLRNLRSPGGKIYDRYAEYKDDLLAIDSGKTSSYFNYYLNRYAQGSFMVEKDIIGGILRLSGGLTFKKAWPHDYTGDSVAGRVGENPGENRNAVMGTTKLRRGFESGGVIGFNGGWDNVLRAGLAFDTRDVEANPRRGMFHELFINAANNLVGSDFTYWIATLSTRWFFTPIPRYKDLIVALRAAGCAKSGHVPFFSMNFIPTSDNYLYGLGGGNTLRGYTQSRFVGPLMFYGNGEARWVVTEARIKDLLLEFMLVPFVDAGRVYDSWKTATLSGMKYSYGGGIRTAMNQAFVLCFDFGFSKEQSAEFYMTFGTIF